MAEPEVTPAQLAEYETQLADVEALLEATPNDESLVALKKDLRELVTLTKNTLQQQQQPASLTASVETPTVEAAVPAAPATLEEATQSVEAAVQAGLAAATAANEEAPEEQAAADGKKKKKKKLKDFVLPEHLIPLDTDTEAERNKKRRTAKALKNKWREQKKQLESEQKQKSWQSFQKKTKKRGTDESIFATKEGVDARVGVISKKQMTETSRKRHKHSGSM